MRTAFCFGILLGSFHPVGNNAGHMEWTKTKYYPQHNKHHESVVPNAIETEL